jgi:hypothetical protein
MIVLQLWHAAQRQRQQRTLAQTSWRPASLTLKRSTVILPLLLSDRLEFVNHMKVEVFVYIARESCFLAFLGILERKLVECTKYQLHFSVFGVCFVKVEGEIKKNRLVQLAEWMDKLQAAETASLGFAALKQLLAHAQDNC